MLTATFGLDPSHGKRTHPDSILHYNKERIRQHVLAQGGTWRDGQPWRTADVDGLLDHWFDLGQTALAHIRDSGGPTAMADLCVLVGRSARSVATKLWKMGARYHGGRNRPDPSSCYRPRQRACRTGLPFGATDLALLTFALHGEGLPNGACQPDWLSRILGRDEAEVRGFLLHHAQRDVGLGVTTPPRHETEAEKWQRIATLVYAHIEDIAQEIVQELRSMTTN